MLPWNVAAQSNSVELHLCMRECKKCGDTIPLRVKIDGKERNLKNRKYCFVCSPFGKHNTKKLHVSPKDRKRRDDNGKRVTEYRRRQKRRAVEYKGGRCQKCGYNKCIKALEFHHLDPSQKDFAFSGRCISWEKMRPELDKCVMLCRNCHAEVHDGLATPEGFEPPTQTLTKSRSDQLS